MAEQYNPDTGQWEQIPGTREQAGAPLNQFVADTGAALVSAIPF